MKRARDGTGAAGVRSKGGAPKALRALPLAPKIHKKNERTGGLLGMTAGTGAEKKYLDTSISGATIPIAASGSITLLNGVVQGTDANQRIGRKVTWESVLVRFVCRPNATTPLNSAYRIMLVVDKQANGAAPNITDIFETATFASPNAMANRARFVTLWDKKGVITTSNEAVTIEELFLRKKFQTIYSGTAATIGSIASGALYLVLMGDVATVSGVLIAGTIRLRYTDDS